MTNNKQCRKCQATLPLSAFPKAAGCVDGHSHVCKGCKRQQAVDRKAANPDHYKEKSKELRRRNHEARIEWQRQWRKANPEKYREQARNAYWKDPEKYRKRSAEYAKKNPEIANAQSRRRKAKIKGAKIEAYTDAQVLAVYGANCHICGLEIDLNAPRWSALQGWELGLHIDHVVPISKGGADSLGNVRPSHGVCNLKKGSNHSF